MKPKLILMSHGYLAKELLNSAEMIVGKIEDAWAISMTMEDGKEGLKRKLDEILATFNSDDPLLFIVDILSGTPCNLAVETMYERENTKVITGLNLAMAIEYATEDNHNLDSLSDGLVNSSKEIIKVIEKEVINLEEDYED